MSDESNKDEKGKGALTGAFAPQEPTPEQPEQPAPQQEQPQPGQGDPNSEHPALKGPSEENRARHAQMNQKATRGQLALSYYGGTFYSTIRQVERPQTRQRERRGPER